MCNPRIMATIGVGLVWLARAELPCAAVPFRDVKDFGFDWEGSYVNFLSMARSPDRCLVVTGVIKKDANSDVYSPLVFKLNQSYQLVWKKFLSCTMYSDKQGSRVRILPKGNILVLGESVDGDGGGFLLELSKDGDIVSNAELLNAGAMLATFPDGDSLLLWKDGMTERRTPSHKIASSLKAGIFTQSALTDLQADMAGNFYVCGISGKGGAPFIFINKYSHFGKLAWSRSMPYSEKMIGECKIAVGSEGSVFLIGAGYINRYNGSGGLMWSRNIVNPQDSVSSAGEDDYPNNAYNAMSAGFYEQDALYAIIRIHIRGQTKGNYIYRIDSEGDLLNVSEIDRLAVWELVPLGAGRCLVLSNQYSGGEGVLECRGVLSLWSALNGQLK